MWVLSIQLIRPEPIPRAHCHDSFHTGRVTDAVIVTSSFYNGRRSLRGEQNITRAINPPGVNRGI